MFFPLLFAIRKSFSSVTVPAFEEALAMALIFEPMHSVLSSILWHKILYMFEHMFLLLLLFGYFTRSPVPFLPKSGSAIKPKYVLR